MEARQLLEEAIELAVDNGVYAEVHGGYSGRGMYGRTCVGVVTDNVPVFMVCLGVAGADLFDDDGERIVKFARGTSQDSMGLDSIVYWPRFESETRVD